MELKGTALESDGQRRGVHAPLARLVLLAILRRAGRLVCGGGNR
jgi:hypothetical protein